MTINQIHNNISVSSSSFNVGFIFYYWPYYRDTNKEIEKEQHEWNINDHSGYTIKQLYVPPKWGTFKQEVLQYGFIDIDEYYELVIQNAIQHFATNKVRNIKATINYENRRLHYDILDGTPFAIPNLMALILYCNFSALSTAFSATFRKLTSKESISSVKTRNQQYWWLSKILRETVELFGDKGDHNSGKGTGPYYSGMSFKMVLPEFYMRLCSPTSTSKQLEIASRFSGRNGIIIQLNDNVGIGADGLRSFNCSWISSFSEEDERLYCGGNYRICVQSVRFQVDGIWKNYEEFIHAMFVLDGMVSGAPIHSKNKPTSKDIMIISSLIEYELNTKKSLSEEYDEYMLNTFRLYCTNKKTVVFSMSDVEKRFKGLSSLLFCALERNCIIDENSEQNLVKQTIFNLFGNLETIRIVDNTASFDSYPFSLPKLLSLWAVTTSRPKIVITARHPRKKNKYENGRSWLYEAFCAPSMEIHRNSKQYKTELTIIKGDKIKQIQDTDCLSFEQINC